MCADSAPRTGDAHAAGTDCVPIRRALISASDKSGLIELAAALHAAGAEIVSTGGTAAALAKAGIPVTPIEKLTGFPEMLDGRVKTLHPKVHGGLLGVRSNAQHQAAMKEHGIQPIDLVCVTLYPFERTVATPGVAEHEAIEQIDIGGPSMLRSAAKNFQSVTVLTAPAQYERVIRELREHKGCTTLALRREFAAAVFARTAEYDAAIATWMEAQEMRDTGDTVAGHAAFPRTLRLFLPRVQELRYGENPHQAGAVYGDGSAMIGSADGTVVNAQLLHGKPLSYNNLLDAAAALELVQDLDALATSAWCAVIKHTNPCGAASGANAKEAFSRAWAGDPLAAFGGVVAFSAEVDAAAAEAMADGQRFLEVVIAPSFAPKALAILSERWKNARVLAVGTNDARHPSRIALRSIPGGVLVQERDTAPIHAAEFTHAAGPTPSAQILADAGAMFAIAKHLKSNAVCIGANGMLWGAGAGQMDRVASCRNAIMKAHVHMTAHSAAASGSQASAPVAASDAFFPFADGPTLLVDAGVKCIVHPGGSKRDQDTFDLCNARGITCLLTGTRHFRH